jgi:hypothetical protein
MQRLPKDGLLCGTNRQPSSPPVRGAFKKNLLLLLLATTMLLSACGGSGSGGSPQQSAKLAGNWQFSLAPQTDGNSGDPIFVGGLQGGFLLQNNGSVTGQAAYYVGVDPTAPCNSGSATITGTLSGQTVTLNAVAGTETFALTGTLSADGSTMAGNYTSTVAGGASCGYATTQSWSALLVPPLAGTIAGNFHSGGLPAQNGGFGGHNFPLTGTLAQGPNIGAANATVTGTLSFIDPTAGLSDYPCFPDGTVSVNGQISGNAVILQLIGSDGSVAGQIGTPLALSGTSGSGGVASVVFESTTNGYVLHTLPGPASSTFAYVVNTKACPGGGTVSTPGDIGYICLALNSKSACEQPITLSPGFITFPPLALGSAKTQKITLTNNFADASKLSVSFINVFGGLFEGESDFTGAPSFVADASDCASLPGPGASCSINVTFNPQESCPWLPFPQPGNPTVSISGAAPQWCPFPQEASVAVNGASLDAEVKFTVLATGLGVSAIRPNVPELDFSAEDAASSEQSPPQTLTFTNTGENSVQILPRSATCESPLPRPPTSAVSGLQVVGNGTGSLNNITPDNGNPDFATIDYNCDMDPVSALPNFQFVPGTDTCSGTTLSPGASCSLEIVYAPQKNTNTGNGLDYFLELNTVGEVDSGRFPVELKSNPPSTLRMSPSAGLDFGIQPVGEITDPLTITLSNDGTVANPQTVTFVGKIQVAGNFIELDDCQATLAPGESCTLNVTFKPSVIGFTAGSLTINYSVGGTLAVPQKVYLRGTGQ